MKKILGTLFLSFIVVMTVASCALYGPTYTKPPSNSPTSWSTQDSLSYSSNAELPMMAWWQRFDDPALSDYIETALKNNNNIQMAVGQSMAAQGQLEQIQFAWVPTLDMAVGSGNKSSTLVPSGYSAGLVPGFSLNIFQWIRSTEYAKANLAAVDAAKDAVRLTIISQTAGSYFACLGQSYLLELQRNLVEDSKQLLDLSQIQYEKGLISLYTLQQYEQQYDTAKVQLPIMQNNVVVANNALRLLLNENPGNISVVNAQFMRLKSQGIVPVNLPSQVLKNRPDIREAEQQLIAANANIGVATSTFFPTVTMTGALGSSSEQLENIFSSGTAYWTHQSQLAFPALNIPAFGQIKMAKGQYYSAHYNYIQTVRAAFESVDNDLSAHDRYYASFEAQMQNSNSAKKAYDLAKISYEKGLYSYPTLLTNKVNWDNAQINLAKYKLAQLNTIVQLYQDLGGGYEVNNSQVSEDKA